MKFKSNHFPFSLDSDSNLIINFFVRDIRKRFKHINISNQDTFKPKSFISLMTFILSLLFILSDQRVFKPRSFTFFIFINIVRKQIKVAFFKVYLNKRIFERDFSHYNKILNKIFRQFKRIFKFLNKDYVSIYLFDSIIILNSFMFESSSKSINDNDFFDIII